MPGPGGTIGHAEVAIGDSVIMFSDPTPEFGARNGMLYVYVEDVDATYKRALEAGRPLSKSRRISFVAIEAPGF